MRKYIVVSLFLLSIGIIHAQDNRTTILQNLEGNTTSDQDLRLTATTTSATRLFGEKDDLTSVIMIIPSDTVVDVIGSDSTYLHVIFEDNEGYIFRRHAILNESEPVSAPVVQKQETVQEQQEETPQQVSRFTYLENKYGTNMAARLISGKIWKGMSSEMVRDSWGKPQTINRTISGNTIEEEWFYKNTWLYIENDILTDWGPIK
jgi:hypothetical protein